MYYVCSRNLHILKFVHKRDSYSSVREVIP